MNLKREVSAQNSPKCALNDCKRLDVKSASRWRSKCCSGSLAVHTTLNSLSFSKCNKQPVSISTIKSSWSAFAQQCALIVKREGDLTENLNELNVKMQRHSFNKQCLHLKASWNSLSWVLKLITTTYFEKLRDFKDVWTASYPGWLYSGTGSQIIFLLRFPTPEIRNVCS